MSASEYEKVLQALEAAQTTHPDLVELLAFHRELYAVQYAVQGRLPAWPAPGLHSLQQRADAGFAQVAFDDLSLEPRVFGALVSDVAAILARHNPGWKPVLRPEPEEDLVRRARHVLETWETLTAPEAQGAEGVAGAAEPPSVLDQAVALALSPYLRRAAEGILPAMAHVLWRRPVCPICGGRPNLALLEEERGARRLVCSRCDAAWDYTRVGCPFCRSQANQTYFLGEESLYRLYVCPDCRAYLKTVDLRAAGRPIVPAVERLLSVGMDLAALRAGYRG